MSTMVKPQETGMDGRSRPLTITANLLPPEILETRATRKVRRIVVACLAVFVLLLGGWYAFATFQFTMAQRDLDAAQDNAHRLRTQQNQYNEVIRTQAESDAVKKDLSTVLADDLQWVHLMASVGQAAPPGTGIADISGSLKSDAGARAAAPATAKSAATPTAGGKTIVATVTVTGSAPSKPDVATFLDGLAKIQGAANPHASTITTAADPSGKPAVVYLIQFDVTADALGGRFTKDGGGK